ncbi:MAG: DUF5615 family PIN-like protein [Ignavibacteriales bacterium]|nr:hypothetical protein [Ignavibacteriaceae bacterium]QOJ29075.1 MAG: DUF5615 family PIN-like protein [Ignavibacteriales bacterium]
MKLLFDQNISFRIVKKIQHLYPDSKQVTQLGLNGASDQKIWEFAKIQGYSIVTFDSDFYDYALINGMPPKIIWLRTGNTSTNQIAGILTDHAEKIKEFLNDQSSAKKFCLEIFGL